jgi:hypothetical protein
LRETPGAVTPFGGLSVFIEFLQKIGYRQQVSECMPVHLESPNAIDPGETYTVFLISVLAGARRFAHASLLRADRASHALLGTKRFPTDGTIRNLFKRFTPGMVVRMYEPLWAWQLERLPRRTGGYSLDLDSTVQERYGQQEGVKQGYNPRKPGRGSHPPLLAVLGEGYFILHGWLRSGNTAAGRGVEEFLREGWRNHQAWSGFAWCGPTRFSCSGVVGVPGEAGVALHRGGTDDAVAEVGSGAGGGVAGAG